MYQKATLYQRKKLKESFQIISGQEEIALYMPKDIFDYLGPLISVALHRTLLSWIPKLALLVFAGKPVSVEEIKSDIGVNAARGLAADNPKEVFDSYTGVVKTLFQADEEIDNPEFNERFDEMIGTTLARLRIFYLVFLWQLTETYQTPVDAYILRPTNYSDTLKRKMLDHLYGKYDAARHTGITQFFDDNKEEDVVPPELDSGDNSINAERYAASEGQLGTKTRKELENEYIEQVTNIEVEKAKQDIEDLISSLKQKQVAIRGLRNAAELRQQITEAVADLEQLRASLDYRVRKLHNAMRLDQQLQEMLSCEEGVD